MEDIKVIHKLDESLNQRIIIIKNEEEPLDIITSTNKQESYYHATYLKYYLNFEYLKDNMLQQVKNRIHGSDGIIVSNISYYLMKKYQDIIFIETTNDNEEERYGIINFPDSISEIQYQKLKEIFHYLKNFTSILVQGGLKSDGVIVTETTYFKELSQGNIKIENIEDYLKEIRVKTEEKHL